MEQPEEPARVDEGDEEQETERRPDVGRVDLLGDRAAVAARERVRELGAVPSSQHLPVRPSTIAWATSVRLASGPVK